LWENLLLKWLPVMRAAAPDCALRAELGRGPELLQGLGEGRVESGVRCRRRRVRSRIG
jgi:hypothetical protein